MPNAAALPLAPNAGTKRNEILVASGLLSILMVMVVPLPGFLLDLLLAANITVSLAVLLTAFYATRPLEFAIFPGLLLITTLFRLSLNVASTRLILSEAKAGALIAAFGEFVVAGNYVVGAIIFLVLVIINFVVITKGSGRVAEVAARFTLDALPGKQMAIDADLNAGLIDEREARERRENVGREADFYGAMDGASKFVRGDAVAGLIITGINIVGGLVVGVAQYGMSFGEAGGTFALLSIGDGLVSQIPALLISTAAGIIVTRASGGGTLAKEVQGQLFTKADPLLITGGFLMLLGIIPGLPIFPFWTLGGLMLFLGRKRLVADKDAAQRAATAEAADAEADAAPAESSPADLLLVDPLELEIGYGLISAVDPGQQGDLLERVKMLRQQLALELGIVIPPVRIRDNVSLEANRYVIKLRGNPIGDGEAMAGYHLVLLQDENDNVPGIRVKDPTFGLPAVWVPERSLPEIERMGLTAVEAPAVITTHLLEVLRQHAHKLLDRQEVKKLLDKVKESAPALVDELVPNVLTLGSVQKVLKKLLQERIPIRDLVTILEALADHGPNIKNIDVLIEYTRAALAPTITRQFHAYDEKVYSFVLDPHLEQFFMEKAQSGQFNANTLGLEPERGDAFMRAVDAQAKTLIAQGVPPVLLTSPVLRPTLFNFLSPVLSDLAVLSYNDLLPDASVEVTGQVQLA